MLDDLGVADIDGVFDTIPESLRLRRPLNLPEGKSEFDVVEELEALASKNGINGRPLISFAGGGAYDHDIPAAVRALGSRSEFVTAYTPYQPEVAQGVLEALFEFQTLIARLSGLEVANASLYDGATALVEAVNLACAATGRRRILVSDAINPHYLETVTTFAKGTGVIVERFGLAEGLVSASMLDDAQLGEDVAAVIISNPNFFGAYEDVAGLAARTKRVGALLIQSYDPISVSLLASPGALGADVAVAEGQTLGIPLSFGGPYLGLFSVNAKYTRLVPGRLVGTTHDASGRLGYVTTLRTREQDIRREKASSNVCTNQTLMAVQSTIYMSWIGKQGFRELGATCVSRAHSLAEQLCAIDGVSLLTPEFFREFTISLPVSAVALREQLVSDGYLAGVLPSTEQAAVIGQEALILTATERRSEDEIARFAQAFARAVQTLRSHGGQ
jgi:glycine dehydrogenase subunit 1